MEAEKKQVSSDDSWKTELDGAIKSFLSASNDQRFKNPMHPRYSEIAQELQRLIRENCITKEIARLFIPLLNIAGDAYSIYDR